MHSLAAFERVADNEVRFSPPCLPFHDSLVQLVLGRHLERVEDSKWKRVRSFEFRMLGKIIMKSFLSVSSQ